MSKADTSTEPLDETETNDASPQFRSVGQGFLAGRGKMIISRRKQIIEALGNGLRRYWFLGLAVILALWASRDAAVLNLALLALQFIGRLLFAVLFMVVQFGALFWFISRTRTVVVKPGDEKQVTFDEYWGQPALLRLVKQWISLLGDRDKFVEMGGQYINGLMLFGEPGTGKTLLAKAMAGEAGIAFMSVEGSGFRGMFWGMDTLKMMTFVKKARKLAREYGACIAYIDEIDAVGMNRGGVMGGGGQMSGGMMGGGMMNGALTRLLYEMDGIAEESRGDKFRAKLNKLLGKPSPKRDWHVLFMGSTNRPDVLDPALLRPGRFDQVIKVERPDRVGRKAIVEGYLSKIRHDGDDIDVDAIVADTPHATPAQVMSAITKDSVRRALFDNRDYVNQDDIDQAIQEQLVGMANPIEDMDPVQLRQVAYHEAGHALVRHYVMPDTRISRVSIIRRSSGALGYVLGVETDEIYALPLKRVVANIMTILAGHIAVKVFMGEFWTGASGDYDKARAMFLMLGVHGYFGPPVSQLNRTVKDLSFSDERVEKMWMGLEEQVENLLTKHAEEVHAVAEELLEKKDLSSSEVVALLGKNSVQLAQEEGREMESVLEEIGTSVDGLAYKRQQARVAAIAAEEEVQKQD